MPVTKEPVTVSGWYEHTDGTVGKYAWKRGGPYCITTCASWAEVKGYEDRIAQAVDDALKGSCQNTAGAHVEAMRTINPHS